MPADLTIFAANDLVFIEGMVAALVLLVLLYRTPRAERIVGDTGTVYFMTKSALHSLTRGLARELGPRDITANLVQPGSTDTDMNPANGDSADFQRSLMPLGRYAEPQDVAAAVTFLASPAARHITGAIINVDGGLNT